MHDLPGGKPIRDLGDLHPHVLASLCSRHKDDKSFYPGRGITPSADFRDTDVVLPAYINWFVEGTGAISVSPTAAISSSLSETRSFSHIIPLFHLGSRCARNDLVERWQSY